MDGIESKQFLYKEETMRQKIFLLAALLSIALPSVSLAASVKATCRIGGITENRVDELGVQDREVYTRDGETRLSIKADTMLPLTASVTDSLKIGERTFALEYKFNQDGKLKNRWSVKISATRVIQVPSSDPHSDRLVDVQVADLDEVLLTVGKESTSVTFEKEGLPTVSCTANVNGDASDFNRYAFQKIEGKALRLNKELAFENDNRPVVSLNTYIVSGRQVQKPVAGVPFCRLVVELKTWQTVEMATLPARLLTVTNTGILTSNNDLVSYFHLGNDFMRLYCEKSGDLVSLEEFNNIVGDLFDVVDVTETTDGSLPATTFNQAWTASDSALAEKMNVPTSLTLNSVQILMNTWQINTNSVDGNGTILSPAPNIGKELDWRTSIKMVIDGKPSTSWANLLNAGETSFVFKLDISRNGLVHAIVEANADGTITSIKSVTAEQRKTVCEENPVDTYHPRCETTVTVLPYSL
jgi:hypothetical protein